MHTTARINATYYTGQADLYQIGLQLDMEWEIIYLLMGLLMAVIF